MKVRKGCECLEERQVSKAHKLVINNRKTCMLTGVLDVLAFDLNEVLLETEQGMLMVKGKDLHVNRLSLEKGEVDLAGQIDSVSYSEVHHGTKKNESLFVKLFK
jgi:sporulation protein YabP